MTGPMLERVYQIEHGDYDRAGEASASIKRALRKLGVAADIMRRVSVAAYEAEMNIAIHSLGGEMHLCVDASHIILSTSDRGPGIKDIDSAMREGFSTADHTARSMGFGAGMGLPNIRRNADKFQIESEMGKGTQIEACFYLT